MNDLLKRIIVALDVPDFEKARDVVDHTKGTFEYIKIGMQAFYGYGDRILPYVKDLGFKIFLDLKLCDIPNTVSSAIRSLARYQFDLLTVHISGGKKMLEEAVIALRDINPYAGIVGVTVLTSLSADDLVSLGYRSSLKDIVTTMCRLAVDSNLYGIVCSAADLDFVVPIVKGRLKIITPGIRLTDDKRSDQKRVETPINAFAKGSDFIVMGRAVIEGDIKANIDRLNACLNKKG